MDVQVTGCSGFVGKNLAAYFENSPILISALSLRDQNWEFNINDDGLAIIHLAGKAHDTESNAREEEYFEVNCALTIALFDRFLESNIRDFFYFSSVKAVADTVDEILWEDHHADPKTPYGKSKLAAENYILSKKLPSGKRLFIIRPCMIHGPDNKGNLNLLYKMIKKGLPWPLAAFDNRRSFLSIGNLSFLIENILKNDQVASGVYNFADDEALSTNDIIAIINNTLNRKNRRLYIPKSVILACVRFGDLFNLPLNSERLKKLTESYVVSNLKIKNELNLKTLPVSAKRGLELTIANFEIKK